MDLVNISSGGIHSAQKITYGAGHGAAFQAPFAAAVKEAVGDHLLVASVGIINNGHLAQEALQEYNVDVVLVGRAFQRDTGMAWHFNRYGGANPLGIYQFAQLVGVYLTKLYEGVYLRLERVCVLAFT